MLYELLEFKTHSGSRQFAELPETVFSDELREAAKKLKGARESEFLTDWATEVCLISSSASIDFQLTINLAITGFSWRI